MATVLDHFKDDFLHCKSETLRDSFSSVVIPVSGRQIQLAVHFHHDSRQRKSMMSVLRPTDLSAEEYTSFCQTSLSDLRQRCITESAVTNYPPYQLSNDVYLYMDAVHDESIQQIGELRVVARGPNYAARMLNLRKVIDAFVRDYEHNDAHKYLKAAAYARGLADSVLKDQKVLSVLSHRAKDPLRLKDKLWQRAVPLEEPEAQYLHRNDIINDLVDLAGVRVALYFPGDRQRTVDALSSILPCHKSLKSFPDQQRKKLREMRFAGYRATHLRLRVPGASIEEDPDRYFPVEIQIASLIMHAWSEVEHDLDYKQLDGLVSDLELELLDQLNGLALAGEISLEQLQTARNNRIKREQFKNL